MKDLLLISCLAIASFVFTACGNKHADKPAPQSDTTHVQTPVQVDTLAPSVLSAAFLDSVYHADPKEAAKEYKGKTITIKGEIKAVHKNKSTKHKGGLNWITIVTGSKDTLSHLTCVSHDVHFVADLKKGQQVTVKGTCVGTVGRNVQLKESEIVQ